MTAKADTTPLREGLELARDILRGPHYQGGASLMAIGRAFGAIDAALAEPVSREKVSDEIRPYLDAAARHADGLSAQLEIQHWCPSRSHVEQARNTIRNIVNKARAALASEPVAGTATPQQVQEACAQVADRLAEREDTDYGAAVVAQKIAASIRALIPPALAATPAPAGREVQDTYLVGGPPDLKAMSGSVESNRVIQLHFRRPVNDKDREWLLEAINAKIAADGPSLPPQDRKVTT